MNQTLKVVITGGGTAGHITPAIAIAKELEKIQGASIFYLGNENFLERQISQKESYPFFHINSQGMEGKHPIEKWKNFLARNSRGVSQAYRHLRSINPDFIVSTGGFVTAPVLVAAKLLSIPYFVHEQNTVMGRVNKLFTNGARDLYLSFEETIGVKGNKRGKVFGNPVSINEKIETGADLVVLGGSGGSEFLNHWALEFAKKNPKIKIHLQCGMKNVDTISKLKQYQSLKSNLKLYGFVDIKEMYKKAKFVVTRGGTSSLFELSNAEIPAIIVPLPNSMDNHQYMNGLHFQKQGGMKVVEQSSQKDKGELDKTTLEWWNNNKELEQKRKKLSQMNYRECAYYIAEDMLTAYSVKKGTKKES